MKEEGNIIETAARLGNFRVFTEALAEAGLKTSLMGPGPYTVFAPTDQAFAKLPQSKLAAMLEPDNREMLQLLLRNHIVAGKLMASELQRLNKTKTAKGEELAIESRDGLWVNDARILSPDLEASNGVVHAIDTVLLPHTRVATAH
jgi:uncharacterized surface protein with fasciclin (FAS1) repeats